MYQLGLHITSFMMCSPNRNVWKPIFQTKQNEFYILKKNVCKGWLSLVCTHAHIGACRNRLLFKYCFLINFAILSGKEKVFVIFADRFHLPFFKFCAAFLNFYLQFLVYLSFSVFNIDYLFIYLLTFFFNFQKNTYRYHRNCY